MGRKFDEVGEMKMVPASRAWSNGDARVNAGRVFAAGNLRDDPAKLKQAAGKIPRTDGDKAVITCRRSSTMPNGRRRKMPARLLASKARIVNEPTARRLPMDWTRRRTRRSPCIRRRHRSHLYSRGRRGGRRVKATNARHATQGDNLDQRITRLDHHRVQEDPASISARTAWRCSAAEERRKRPRWSCPR